MSSADLLVQRRDLLVQGRRSRRRGPCGRPCWWWTRRLVCSVRASRQLPAAGDQGLQFGLVFRAFFSQPGRGQLRAKLDQDAGVDGVGLGQDAQGLGEVAHLPGLTRATGRPASRRASSSGRSRPPVASTTMQAAAPDGESSAVSVMPAGVVGEADRPAVSGAGQIELAWRRRCRRRCGPADSGEWSCDGPFLANASAAGARRGGSVGCSGEGHGTGLDPLRGGRVRPRHDRSWAGRRVRVTPRSARRPADAAAATTDRAWVRRKTHGDGTRRSPRPFPEQPIEPPTLGTQRLGIRKEGYLA